MINRKNLHEAMRIAGREWSAASSNSDPNRPQYYKGNNVGGWYDNEEEVYHWLKEMKLDDEVRKKVDEYLETHQILD